MITCARAPSRRSVSPTACAVWPPMPASISSKTIVSPPPTAAIASAIRDSSPPEAVWATGANGRPAFGRMRKATSSAPVAPGLALAQLDPELALAEADAAKLRRDGLRKRLRSRLARLAAARFVSVCRRFSALGQRRSAAATGSAPSSRPRARRAHLARAQELVVRLAARSGAARRRSGRVAPRPASSRPGSASSESRNRAQLATPSRAGGARRRGARRRPPSSGASARQRRERPLGLADKAGRALALVGRERLRRRGRRRASSETWRRRSRSVRSASSVAGLETLRVLDERPQLGEPSSSAAAPASSSSWRRRAPASSRQAARSSAREAVRHPRTNRGRPAGTRAGRDGAARTGRTSRSDAQPQPQDPRAPRFGPRRRRGAPVGEHAPREHEPVLALGPKLGERLQALLHSMTGVAASACFPPRSVP